MGVSRKIYKNLIAVFLLSVLAITAVTFLFIRMYLVRQTEAEADEIAASIEQELREVFDEANRLCSIVGKNYDIQAMIRTPAPGTFVGQARERTEINAKIGLLTQSYTGSIDNIGLFLDDGRKFKFGQYSVFNRDYSSLDWYRALRGSRDFSWLGLYDTSQALHTLEWRCLVGGTALRNMKTNRPCGVVVVEISTDTLAGVVAQNVRPNVVVRLSGASRGESIYLDDTLGDLGNAVETRKILDYFTLEVSVREMGALGDAGVMLLAISLGSLFFFIILLRVSSASLKKSIAQPIEQLLECMESIRDDALPTDIDIRTDVQEISRLIDGFKLLLDKIRVMLKNREHEQKQIRRAQVSALQAQINPHFLYNTMDSISWLIRTGENEKALGTLYSFASLFRLALSNGRSYVTLSDELQYVRNYIGILNVRYNGQLAFSIEVDDERALCAYIPKLVLQPIVENAIEHGIGMREDQAGRIDITVKRCPQGIRICVTDDGVGIEEDRLAEINRRLAACEKLSETQKNKSYGISNVNDRFKLSYGQEYGVSYESVAGSYTRAIIICPLCNAKGEALS